MERETQGTNDKQIASLRKKRNCRRLFLAAILLATAAVCTSAWPTGPGPCRRTFDQVSEGMTFDEVKAVVGAPPGHYERRAEHIGLYIGGARDSRTIWTADDGSLVVWFDESNTAIRVMVLEREPDSTSFFARLRDRLGF